ncbi:phage tail protein [Schaalia sp. ZJ405]|uniref:phage tail tube protein n=1 Tax=Schaalia sp. ZJ405 TaxID=2709403 RepID=UPI0013EDD3E3|nr:phage tail protein [Schaalia sp. ZJ405]QPK80819.1 phage tail protein [Schaalia sp. ZJ405]
MAKPNSALVTAAKPVAAGAISAASIDAKVPTDASTELDAAFKRLGYVSEDGLTNGIEMDTEDVKDWGGDTVLVIRTSRTETFTWKFIQTLDPDVLAEVYGADNVKGTLETGLTVIHNSSELPRRAYVFEMLMTGGVIKRIVVPNSQITEIGEVVYTKGEPVGYEVTLMCYPDEAGNTVYEYLAKPKPQSSEG